MNEDKTIVFRMEDAEKVRYGSEQAIAIMLRQMKKGEKIMDALEFAKEMKRMCDSYDVCRECELFKGGAAVGYCHVDELEKAVPIVEKWSVEHPKATNLDHMAELLEKAGCEVDKEYVANYCCPPNKYFKKDENWCYIKCSECRKWWLEEYKGKDINVPSKGEEND